MKLRYLSIVPLLKAISLCSGSIGGGLVALLNVICKEVFDFFNNHGYILYGYTTWPLGGVPSCLGETEFDD